MRCKVEELVTTALKYGEASASNGKWTARGWPSSGIAGVCHYGTLMITFYRGLEAPSKVVRRYNPVEGWSVSDRQGINSILKYEGINARYDQLWPTQPPVPEILEADPAILEEEGSLDEWEKFEPPVHVSDTVI